MNLLFEVTVLNGSVPVTLRMAHKSANADGCLLNDYQWKPLITKRHSTSGSWSEDGDFAQGSINHTSLTFYMSSAYENEEWSAYEWNGGLARIFVQTGDIDVFNSYKQVFEGSVSALERQGIYATVALLGPDELLNRDLLSLEYAGSGNAEGPASLKGKFKPFVIGSCVSVDPILIDPAKWIYQVHGYGAVSSIKAYEYAQSLGNSKSDAANYAALASMTLSPGEWATCLAQGMFRLGATPSQRISADVVPTNTQYVGDIIRDLLMQAGIPVSKIGAMSIPFNGTWSSYVTEQVQLGDLARQAAYHGGALLFADGKGVWRTMNYYSPKTAVALNADRSTSPIVKTYRELTAAPSVWKVKVAADPCWGVHLSSEVSPALKDANDAAAASAAVAQAAKEAAQLAVAEGSVTKSRIEQIEADGWLDRSEKADVIRRFGDATAERTKLLNQGTEFNVTTERGNLSNTYDALKSYLEGLSPAYTDTSQNTAIDRAAFNSAWGSFIDARTELFLALDGKVRENAAQAHKIANQATDKADNAQDTADKAEGKADTVTKNLVGEKLAAVLQKQIDDIAALHITYGAGALSASTALAKKNQVAIRTLETRVEKDGSVVSEELLQLTSRLGKSEAGLSEFRQTVADANYASVTSVDKMIAKYGEEVTAYQLAEKESYAADKSAFSKSLEEMGAKVVEEGKIREGKISELRNVILDENGNIRVEKISELGAKITEAVDGKMTEFEGAIKEVEKAYKDGDAIVAEKVNTLFSSITGPNGEIDKVKAIIENAKNTSADLNNATAEDVKKLSTRLNDVGGATIEQAFKVVSDKVDGVSGAWTLKVQTDQNGEKYVAGIGLAVENGVSAFAVSADTFKLITAGKNPKQVFFADADGVYMPDVRVDKLKAGAIDFEFLNRQSNLNAASGYQALPGGLMLMWGQYRAYIAEEKSISVTFPTSFPNACLSFTATPYISYASNSRDLYIQVVGNAQTGSATIYTQGYKGNAALDGFNWFAVGY